MKRGSVEMSMVWRRGIAGVLVAAAVVGGAVVARADDARPRAAAAAGGLGLSPALIEKPAAAGTVATLTVFNHSAKRMDVTVAARPWLQSSSGAVSVNRRRSLPEIELSDTSFALAAGAEKAVTVTARSGASLYGGIEVIGLPEGSDAQHGIVTGYRVIGSLRLNPATPVLGLRAGSAKVSGRGGGRVIVLPVKNTGNTVRPVTGSVRLKGALGTRQRDLQPVRILPGKTVDLQLSSAGALKPGSYTATVRLKQGGRTTMVTKKVRVSR